ncbi:MAG TPA: hypothetical protein VFC63_25710 [Blastocatellia bacterium]|nr:hypothetical protein [Blastocatellia bacterium]
MDHVSENVTYEQERTSMEAAAGGSVLEGIGGLGAIVLSILALIGLFPMELTSVAAIALGGALLIGGGTIAARYTRFLTRTQADYTQEIVAGGMGMESACGVAGIVLGILALLGINPMTMLPTAAIVFGGALLMASGAMAKLSSMPVVPVVHDMRFGRTHQVTREMLTVASGSEVLVGAAAVVLGILALSGVDPLVLSLVAFLAIGASVVLSGTTLAGRLFSAFSH